MPFQPRVPCVIRLSITTGRICRSVALLVGLSPGSIDRPPKIHPDYCETVIPPNIAPLNFLVEESGLQYCVKIHSKKGRAIQIFSHSSKIIIPQNRWHELLNALEKYKAKYLSLWLPQKPELP